MEAKVAQARSNNRTGLLSLPPELRLQIYDLVYRPHFLPQSQFNPFYCTEDLKQCPKRGRITALHQVNRQLRAECMHYYLDRTTFVFDLSVLDTDTGEPTLVSWAKASPENLELGRNLIINMRIAPRASPMFTIFVSNTKKGQRLHFKESDFRTECNLFARGMRDAAILRQQDLSCIHKRCLRYVVTVNELKQTLRWMDVEIPTLRACLDVSDVVEIAKASKLLELLHIPARWSRVTMEPTAAEDAMVSRYHALIDSEKEIERPRREHYLFGGRRDSLEKDQSPAEIPRNALRRFTRNPSRLGHVSKRQDRLLRGSMTGT